MIKVIPFSLRRRLLEAVCVLFGHNWRGYGCTEQSDFMLEEYSECARCRLENHDRSGYAAAFERQYGRTGDAM